MRIHEILSPSEKINKADTKKHEAEYKVAADKKAAQEIEDGAERRTATRKANTKFQSTMNTQNKNQEKARKSSATESNSTISKVKKPRPTAT